MSWLINNKTPEELGVTVANLGEGTLAGNELVLDVVEEDYTGDVPAELAFNTAVVLTLDGNTMFQGKVRSTPRDGSASSEGMSYSILDAWDELDRTVYQQARNNVIDVVTLNDNEDSIITFGSFKNGAVEWDADVPLGARIRDVVNYAASAGVNVQVGNIIDGIPWFRSSYKDLTCGELLREMMKLMPERVLTIDNRAATPTVNMRKRSDAAALDFDISSGTALLGHSIVKHDDETVPGVAIRYERPVTVDEGNYTAIIEDTAGNVDGVGAVIETVALKAGSHSSEYAPVTCAPIPQEQGEGGSGASDAEILEMFVKHTPELAAIADDHGMAAMLAVLKIPSENVPAQAVKKYSLKVVNDGIPRPDPINPNSEVIAQSEDVSKYPRMLVEGSLPVWAKKRWRIVRAKVTIGVEKSVIDGLADEELREQFKEIFVLEKTWSNTTYMTANFVGEVMGTNATTRNYKRVTVNDLDEPVPVGIAAALLAQLNTARYSGSFSLIGTEINTNIRPGQRVNFTGGRTEWATIGESVQSVQHDVESGSTTVEYGPNELLGANDLIARLQATRDNPISHGLRSDRTVTEGVGGSAASPVFKFAKVSVKPKKECILGGMNTDPNNEDKFAIVPGFVEGGGSSIFVEKDNISNTIGQFLYLEISWTATATEGVLDQGGTMTAAEIKEGGSVPDDDLITATNLTGKHYRALGKWTASGWSKAGCGGYDVKLCSDGKNGTFLGIRSTSPADEN